MLSHDMENDPDMLGLIAASAALTLSGVPFMGPVGAARVGVIGGEVKANPTIEEMKESSLDLVVAGTADAVLMVELEAKELSEETMLKAVMAGHASFQPVIAAIIRLAEKAAKEPRDLAIDDKSAVEKAVLAVAKPTCAPPIRSPRSRSATPPSTRSRPRSRRRCCLRAARRSSPPRRSPKRSTTPRPRWCAGTSSTTSAASTAAT